MGSCIRRPAADSSSRQTRTRHTSANFRSAQCTAGGGQRSARINPARVPRAQVVSRAFKFAQQQCFRRSLHSALCKAVWQCPLVTLQMTLVPACMSPESVTLMVPISANPKHEGLLVLSSLIMLLARLCNSISATKVSLRAGQRGGRPKLLRPCHSHGTPRCWLCVFRILSVVHH